MEDVNQQLTKKSKRARMEQRGKFISFLCIFLIVVVVVSIFYFVASKGLATFFVNKVNLFDFLFGTVWNPSQIGENGQPLVGALPMILGSFFVTFYRQLWLLLLQLVRLFLWLKFHQSKAKKSCNQLLNY